MAINMFSRAGKRNIFKLLKLKKIKKKITMRKKMVKLHDSLKINGERETKEILLKIRMELETCKIEK